MQCAYRLRQQAKGILLASRDTRVSVRTGSPAESPTESSDLHQPNQLAETIFDRAAMRIVDWLKPQPAVVIRLDLSDVDDLSVTLTRGLFLELFRDSSTPGESWRFLQWGGSHVVVPNDIQDMPVGK